MLATLGRDPRGRERSSILAIEQTRGVAKRSTTHRHRRPGGAGARGRPGGRHQTPTAGTGQDAELGLTVLAPGIALFALVAVVAQFAHPV